ncbi:hypothetical protein J1N35_028498 [Gossypium stocksii]|uniref:Uncharacterized protein n=1 Tax=Gossypium stocksii TaxID=47602 RepID=A0A9D3UW14_9ROSI|nr:hypothetical protein J1N35_028498 [Gossypium stocksii]
MGFLTNNSAFVEPTTEGHSNRLNDYVRNFKRIRDELNCKIKDIELQLKAELLRPLGKLVDEKTREMKEFLDNAPNASEGLAIDGPSASLLVPISEVVGEEAVRNKIWACLMQREMSKIGV